MMTGETLALIAITVQALALFVFAWRFPPR
jgi:hypothetical protein